MLLKTKRERTLLLLTVLVVVGGLGYVGYLNYQEKWGQLEQQSGQLVTQYNGMVRTLRNLKTIVSRYERVTADLRLEDDQSFWPILIPEEIDRFMEKAGIVEKGRREAQQPIYHDDVEAIEYRFRVDEVIAPLPQVARFLSLLEEESAVLEVKELTILPADRRRGGQHGVRVRMLISRIVFTRPEVI
jgi:hypothetical protein